MIALHGPDVAGFAFCCIFFGFTLGIAVTLTVLQRRGKL
jgi:hypothetical protein